MIRVLIADDDKSIRKLLSSELSGAGFFVGQAAGGQEALRVIEAEEFDVVLLDLSMPEIGGMDVLKRLNELDAPLETIVLTGNATVPTAVEAMKLGAYDYITKPFNLEELFAVIRKAYEKKSIIRENILLKAQIKRQYGFERIITKSPLMLMVFETVRKAAPSGMPILIVGESGTGKELIAVALHESSGRADKPFVAINCGAIPETMLESELFGHEKGAFTGAHAQKPGLLEVAGGGTIFLDEIGEMSGQLQAKLLRVIETGTFFRVGGVREVSVDVRFVSATNRDLRKELDGGRFRADLYYRLSGMTIDVPPLRDRPEDIPLLVESIIQRSPAFRHKRFSPEAMEVLVAYGWPGNVRELQNVVQRALLLSAGDEITPHDLPADLTLGAAGRGRSLEDVEKEHILSVLKETAGHKGKAAEILGIDAKTLYRKLQSYGVKIEH